MTGQQDSPTTTFNHPDYRLIETRCQICSETIIEARPIDIYRLPYESRGRRVECYRCLENHFRWLSKFQRPRFQYQPRNQLEVTNIE